MTVTRLPTSWASHETPPGYVSAVTLAQRVGITYRQLDYWTRTGLLTPEGELYPGSGTWRCYSPAEVHRAATLRWLLAAGLSLQTCRAVIDELLDTGRARLTDGLVIHLPEDA